MSEQPVGHFTLIDLFWQLFLVVLISTGCYAGWKASETFLVMLAGGMTGWVIGFSFLATMHARVTRIAESQDPGERGA